MGDLDRWIENIKQCELLPELDLKHLCEYVQDLMLEESTVQPVQSPVTICGDIHGQFHDLLELFHSGGDCPETSYIFMVRRASLPPLPHSPTPALPPLPWARAPTDALAALAASLLPRSLSPPSLALSSDSAS